MGLATDKTQTYSNQLVNSMWLTQQTENKFCFANSVSFNSWKRTIDGKEYTNKTYINQNTDAGTFRISTQIYPEYWTAQYSCNGAQGNVEHGMYLNLNVPHSADRILSGSSLTPESDTYHIMSERIGANILSFAFLKGDGVTAVISKLKITRYPAVKTDAVYDSENGEIVYTFESPLKTADGVYITDGQHIYYPKHENTSRTDNIIYRYIPETQKRYNLQYSTLTGSRFVLKTDDTFDLNRDYSLVIPKGAVSSFGITIPREYTISCIPAQLVHEKNIFSYDVGTDALNYDSKALVNKNNVQISAQSDGLHILNNNNSGFKQWAAIPLGNAVNNTIHFYAELRTDNSELNNLYIGLTDGDVQRLDMHNSAENGSLLHVMNIFYNAKDKECNSDGDMVYFLSGANNGWTSKSEDKGANCAEFNGKTHGMKHLAAYDNAGHENISVDIYLTPYGWYGTIGTGDRQKYVPYTPYSYGFGKAWYTLWNTPKNIVLTTKNVSTDNPGIFSKLSVSVLQSNKLDTSGNSVFLPFDEKLSKNAVITANGKQAEFTISPHTQTSSWINAGGNGGGTGQVNLGTRLDIVNPIRSSVYKICVPSYAADENGVSLKRNLIRTFMLNESSYDFIFDRENILYDFAEEPGCVLTENGNMKICEKLAIPIEAEARHITKLSFACHTGNDCAADIGTENGKLMSINNYVYNDSCLVSISAANEVQTLQLCQKDTYVSGDVYIYPKKIEGYIIIGGKEYEFTKTVDSEEFLKKIIINSTDDFEFERLSVNTIPYAGHENPKTELLSFQRGEAENEYTLAYALRDKDTGENITEDCIAITAMYSSDGRLLSVLMTENNYIVDFICPQNTDYVKLFIWKDINTILPKSNEIFVQITKKE